MNATSRWWVLAWMVSIAGCGAPAPSGDAGGANDVGAVDAASVRDAGPGNDAGPLVDAGPGVDAATSTVDAASMPDGGGLGPVVTSACDTTPHDFPAFVDCTGCVPTLSAFVCLDSHGCHVGNDYRIGSPLQPAQCAAADRMFRMQGTGGGDGSMPLAVPGSGWTTRWATTGVTRTWPNSTPADTDQVAIVERLSDHVRYRIAYRVNATNAHVTSVELFTGAIPDYGASTDCQSLPHTFAVEHPAVDSFGIPVYARVCIVAPPYPSCVVAGNFESTPEAEPCARSYAIAFAHGASGPYAQASFPGSPQHFSLESASGGTINAGNPDLVEGLPTGTDVTYVIANGTQRYAIVARWTGSGFIVQSVTLL